MHKIYPQALDIAPLSNRYGHFSGINRKVQFKSIKSPDVSHGKQQNLIMFYHQHTVEKALLMILKWGGEAGTQQAEELGKAFHCIYPGGAGEYGSLPDSGFLCLHSTYRHNLKVYASDEGRVQMTAASFVKVFLQPCTVLVYISYCIYLH